MALTLNNLQRVDMPLNKETKPNQIWRFLQYGKEFLEYSSTFFFSHQTVMLTTGANFRMLSFPSTTSEFATYAEAIYILGSHFITPQK